MPAESMTLERVLLSFPSLISLRAKTDGAKSDAELPRSWNQVARTGTFHSARYGKFSITRDDLARMLRNFNEVTPKSPTELPVDFDHLSMDPKHPRDGEAAGWIKRLELRNNGDELWMEVEWTQDAADAIEQKKYRFVSPSFVKDHTHKDGRKIGTTLLAAAITNHPFLEGMQALTLYNFSAMGDLALARPDETVVNLAEVGQHVTFIENEEATPELSPEERAQVYIVKAVGGGLGEDEFAKLETAEGGVAYGWYPVKVLAPAPATKGNPLPPQQTQDEPAQQEVTMHATDNDQELVNLSNQIARERGLSLRDATIEAARQRPDLVAARRKDIGVEDDADTQARPAIIHNLHRKPDEGFAELCNRTARERKIDLRAAVKLCSEAFRTEAERYESGEML